jgi:hypothetical protein
MLLVFGALGDRFKTLPWSMTCTMKKRSVTAESDNSSIGYPCCCRNYQTIERRESYGFTYRVCFSRARGLPAALRAASPLNG